jgi:uncharacterized phage infection (PIP) family protein YhgE
MRYFGIFSIIIGIIGMAAIIYFNVKVSSTYEELGGISELVTLFIYGRTNKVILIFLQLAGLTFGLISSFKTKQLTGKIGFPTCFLNFLILMYQPY